MGLRQHVLRRAIDSTATLFLILVLNFLLFYRRMPEAQWVSPLTQITQYFKFIFLDGVGGSISEVVGKMPFTLLLFGISTVLAIGLGIILGVIASFKYRTKADAFLTIVLLTPYMIPTWWLAVALQTSPLNRWFPVAHWYTHQKWALVSPWSDPLDFAGDVVWHITLPILAFTFSLAGIYFLVTRNSMTNVIKEDFMTTAKAKGVSPRSIMFRHAIRNAILPITAIVILTPLLLVNAAIPIEYVFSLNGLGYSLYNSLVSLRGFPLQSPLPSLQAIFLIFSVIIIAMQFITDVFHSVLDPRLRVDGGQLLAKQEEPKPRKIRFRLFWSRFKKGKSGLLGLTIILAFITLAVLAPILPLSDPERMNVVSGPEPPNSEHWLGTDELGRDILSRVIWGARISLLECFGAVTMAISVGCLIGLVSGYYDGKWHSYLLDRITDVFLSMPLIVFVIFFPLEPSVFKWIVAIGLSTWGITAKLVRSQVLLTRDKAYIEAARASGASDRYILLHHVAPEAFSVAVSSIIYAAVLVIAIQSTLDFFGFNRITWNRMEEVRVAPFASWGTMLSYSSLYGFIASGQLWLVVPPVVCMVLLTFSLTLIGNKLADALNPRL